MSDRFIRQEGLVLRDHLPNTVDVIGCGAIGRNVAIQLAGIGVTNLRLFDFDKVEDQNRTTQGWALHDVGLLKVDALKEFIHVITDDVNVSICIDRWRPKYGISDGVMMCVDNIESRTAIWSQVKDKVSFYCDGRMMGETLRVITVHNKESREHYATTLFPKEEAVQGSCTSRSTRHCGAIAASLMVQQLALRTRGYHILQDFMFNLASTEVTVMEEES